MTTTYKPLFSGYATAYTTAVGGDVVFTPEVVPVPCSGIAYDGTGVQLCKKGFYLITFTGYIEADAVGVVTVQLQKDSAVVNGAVSSGVAATAGGEVPVAITKLVYIPQTTCPIAGTPSEYKIVVTVNGGVVTGNLVVARAY